jgi:hypothetical protein
MPRILMRFSALISALAMAGLHAAKAADFAPEGPPQGQYQAPPAYGPPPVEQGYAYPSPPAVAYPYPAPPPVAYYTYPAPVPFVVPGPYVWRGPYWRGYGPRFAYGYGHWGHGHRW